MVIAIREELKGIRAPVGMEWLLGCDKCAHGRIYMGVVGVSDAKHLEARHQATAYMRQRGAKWWTAPEEDVVLSRAGVLTFCDCDAGQSAERWTEDYVRVMAEDDERMRSELSRLGQARLARLFERADIPRRFAELTLKGYVDIAGRDPGKRLAIETVKEHFVKGHVDAPAGKRLGILLWGKSDTGKTGVLSPLFMHYLNQGFGGMWVQYNDLLAALRDFKNPETRIEDRIEAVKGVEYLFVDDFGDPSADRVATDYTRDVLLRILDHRNNSFRPTFITSNVNPSRLEGQFHERIVKRLNEMCVIVEVGGRPMRELMGGDDARRD